MVSSNSRKNSELSETIEMDLTNVELDCVELINATLHIKSPEIRPRNDVQALQTDDVSNKQWSIKNGSCILTYPSPEYGQLDTAKRLHSEENEKFPYWVEYMDTAAAQGDLEIVIFLHENRTEGCTWNALDNAAAAGHLEVVKFLTENRTEGSTKRAMCLAALEGQYEVLEYLHSQDSSGESLAMDFAAYSGSLDIIKYLHQNGTQGCSTNAMDWASRQGHLNVVQFLHWNRMEGCTSSAMDKAASNGYLQIVKFLHENRNEGDIERAKLLAFHHRKCEVYDYLCRQSVTIDFTR